MQDNIKLREANTGDIDQIISISNRCFGAEYLTNEYISNQLSASKYNHVAILNNKVVAFCLAHQISALKMQELYGIAKESNLKIAIISCIAVHPDFQRQKLASKLLYKVFNELQLKLKPSEIIYPCWDEPVSKAFCKSLNILGFEKIIEIQNFWYYESLTKSFECIKCGNPCKCTLILHGLKN